MFRAGGTHKSGERYFLIGLTKEDISRVQDGSPIEVDGHCIGIPGKLVVFYGETEDSMVKEFEEAGIELPDQTPAEG